MDPSSSGEAAKELHTDLARKYKMHAAAVETMWRTLDKSRRAKCLKAGAADGVVPKHPLDWSMGDACKLMPEWNLRDITEPGSDFLLDLLKHRATNSLFEQYRSGMNGAPGDHALIEDMMRTRGLRHAQTFKDCYTFFLSDERYGECFRVKSQHDEVLAAFAPAMRAQLCVPQSTAELILLRQSNLLQVLSVMVDDILEECSKTRDRKKQPRKSDKTAIAAMDRLTLQEPAAKLALPDLVDAARDQRDSFDEYLALLSNEPVVLAHAVNVRFFSRPELVVDEKGRRLPVISDRHIGPALSDAVHNAIQNAAVWRYISRLLELLEDANADKAYRAILLQEISNVCHLEYGRAQGLFKRHVQTGTGAKWFRRVSGKQDSAGSAHVTIKGRPEDLTRSDPQLHYMLRLCQPQTDASAAVGWMRKLTSLHAAHPADRDELAGRQADSLSDLAVVVGFIQDLSSIVSLPPLSRKKGQAFACRMRELETELSQLKDQVDLYDFVVPIDNLLEPGKAAGALEALDRFVVEKAGTSMGFLYHDLVEDCLVDLQDRCQQAKAKTPEKAEADEGLQRLTSPAPQAPADRAEQRRQKEKTRPAHSSVYAMAPRADPEPDEATAPLPSPAQTLKVDPSTAEVFSALFAKSQSRGSVTWTAFEAAMTDLGFSVVPKYGSVYTFFPPDDAAVKRSLTVHRPHQSRIEGYLIPIFARRLKRVYGWGVETFEAA